MRDVTVGGRRQREDGANAPDSNKLQGAGRTDAIAGCRKQRKHGADTIVSNCVQRVVGTDARAGDRRKERMEWTQQIVIGC